VRRNEFDGRRNVGEITLVSCELLGGQFVGSIANERSARVATLVGLMLDAYG
jgi:hypothetical protein